MSPSNRGGACCENVSRRDDESSEGLPSYPSSTEKEAICRILGHDENKVKNWCDVNLER